MKNLLFTRYSSAALALLLSSCADDLLVGEKRCFGEGIDCKSDAPTLVPEGPIGLGSLFDIVVSRGVEATWIYDYPLESPFLADAQLAAAPDGGVWMLYDLTNPRLERVNADGEPVESRSLSLPAYLWVDDELRPVIVTWLNGYVNQARLNPLGGIDEWTTGYFPPVAARRFFISGPEGRVRLAEFLERGSYLAEYSAQGELRWKQSDLRDARDFPFARPGSGIAPVAAYQMVALSDGSIAMGVPKTAMPGSLARTGIAGLGSLTNPESAQGITLVEPDGNIRWDIVLGPPTTSMFLAPGLDGSVIYATIQADDLHVALIDREGKLAGWWVGQRVGYHGVAPHAVCSDPAGDVYVVLLTGDRKTPVPTVCRMSASDASAEVVCLGVEDVVQPAVDGVTPPAISAMTAPEPGAVVFALEQPDYKNETSISRLVGVEF